MIFRFLFISVLIVVPEVSQASVARVLELTRAVYLENKPAQKNEVSLAEESYLDKISRSLDLLRAVHDYQANQLVIKTRNEHELFIKCKNIFEYYRQRQIFVKNILGKLLDDLSGFKYIEQNMQHNFAVQTIPAIQNEFVVMGTSPFLTGSYKNVLKQAEDNLKRDIAILRFQYEQKVLNNNMIFLKALVVKYPDLLVGVISSSDLSSIIDLLTKIAEDAENLTGRKHVEEYLVKLGTPKALKLLEQLQETQFISL